MRGVHLGVGEVVVAAVEMYGVAAPSGLFLARDVTTRTKVTSSGLSLRRPVLPQGGGATWRVWHAGVLP